VLLDVDVERVLTFSIKITKSKSNWITVGVVDRKRKEAQYSATSGSAICYNGAQGGVIYYGEDGKSCTKKTGDAFEEGMEVRVEVEDCTVTFTLMHRGSSKVHSITSPILATPRPCFLPLLEMFYEGDSVDWHIS
jgi:hypothetical protein